MVATKAALSIRVDALSDADTKSGVDAPSIGLESRAKLESRLRALEYRSDLTTTKAFSGEARKQQPKFEMSGGAKTYNTAADAVGFLPTQREGAEKIAINAVLDVKEDRRREKEEKRKAKEEKKAKKAAKTANGDSMSVDEPETVAEGQLLLLLTFRIDADPYLQSQWRLKRSDKSASEEKRRKRSLSRQTSSRPV